MLSLRTKFRYQHRGSYTYAACGNSSYPYNIFQTVNRKYLINDLQRLDLTLYFIWNLDEVDFYLNDAV